MKLGKEEIEKIAISVILLIAFLYAYFYLLLAPLDQREIAAKKEKENLAPQIAKAKNFLSDVKALEEKAPAAAETLDQIKSFIPDGAPVAWFPPRIAEFFKRQGIGKFTARVSGELADKDLSGFKKLIWNIDVPSVGIVPLGIALAALENENPLWEITGLQIEATKENPEFQSARLVISTIVKQ